jgi:hypothetical protein
MRALNLLFSFLCIFSCVLAANVPPVSHSVPQPASGKAFYKVFPKNEIETSQTSEFIKKIVGTEDLLPWTDVMNKLMHWTVEASLEEVNQLKANPGVDRVEEFHPPAPPVGARSTRSVDAATESLAKEQITADRYFVALVHDKSPTEILQIQQVLEHLVGKENIHSTSGPNTDTTGWHCKCKIFLLFFLLITHLCIRDHH